MELKQRQALPLEQKVMLTKTRIREWYEHWDGVYLSFSGGKDSTVLLDIIRSLPFGNDIPAVFCDTGLEYPEVREFALERADVVLRPKMTFKQVIEKYGYPVVSKEQANFINEYRHTKSEKLKELRWNGNSVGMGKISEKWKYLIDAPFEISDRCCHVMKKAPLNSYSKQTGRKRITGSMACESQLRRTKYEQHGCNAFDASDPYSTPLGFWTEQDILHYIKDHGLPYASCYGDIIADDLFGEHLVTTDCKRTGCMFCMFGVHLEDRPNRFERMKHTHPKQYSYCINKLGLGGVLDYMGIPH